MMMAVTAVLALALCSELLAESQAVTAHAVRAAFLYNFATFAEWPADALSPGQPLALCVLGDDAMGVALRQTIRGRSVDGHELTVQMVKAESAIRWCHLLYVGGLDATPVTLLLESLKDAPVFTVGDGARFAEHGGVAEFVLENDRMRFAINVTAATRARLTLSSRLLSLATIAKGSP